MSVTQGSSSFSSVGYTLVSARPVVDQANGPSWEVRYVGTPAGITALATSLQSSGARTAIETRDGQSSLTAYWVRDPDLAAASETAFDRWSIVWEETQESHFADPAAIIEAEAYGPAYRNVIESAVNDGEDITLDSATYPIAHRIQRLLESKIETKPRFHPFLRRQRTYSLSYTGTPYRVNVQGIVYTRASLVSTFGIVDPLLSRIPLDPTETLPTGFVYGWYLAQQDFQYTRERGAMKVEENMGWRWGIYNAAASGALYLLA